MYKKRKKRSSLRELNSGVSGGFQLSEASLRIRDLWKNWDDHLENWS